jgi:hypothetical protein
VANLTAVNVEMCLVDREHFTITDSPNMKEYDMTVISVSIELHRNVIYRAHTVQTIRNNLWL